MAEKAKAKLKSYPNQLQGLTNEEMNVPLPNMPRSDSFSQALEDVLKRHPSLKKILPSPDTVEKMLAKKKEPKEYGEGDYEIEHTTIRKKNRE